MFLIIETTNASFKSSDGGSDYANLEQAKTVAVGGSLTIAGEEIRVGKTACSIDVILRDRDGRQHHRMAVAVSVAPLFIAENNKSLSFSDKPQ